MRSAKTDLTSLLLAAEMKKSKIPIAQNWSPMATLSTGHDTYVKINQAIMLAGALVATTSLINQGKYNPGAKLRKTRGTQSMK